MRYAVFDWDNTLRRGFTLFSWMDFLYSEKILDRSVEHKIKLVQEQYADKKITHDEYARISCEIYAYSMKGFSEQRRNELLDQYMEYDRANIFPFADCIFEALRINGVKPIIISGAPEYILERYVERFGIYKIFAFAENYDNGLCTGEVAHNYGMNKRNVIRELIGTYGSSPAVGFGDSTSDIPLFQLSRHSFCIVSDKSVSDNQKFGPDITYVDSEIEGALFQKMVNRAVRRSPVISKCDLAKAMGIKFARRNNEYCQKVPLKSFARTLRKWI